MLSEIGIKRLTGFLFLFILATIALSGGLAVELNADPDQIANTSNRQPHFKSAILKKVGIENDLKMFS